jgi:hypothetical protein
MTMAHPQRPSKSRKPMLVLAAVSLLVLAAAAPALAGPPTGDFAVFAQCQLSSVEYCIYAQATAGELQLGKDTVPIKSTITLQGGSYAVTGGEEFVGAQDGETLSQTPQGVPGGLPAVVAYGSLSTKTRQVLYDELVEDGITGVTATIELVGNPGIKLENFVLQNEVALSLPVQIKLSNPFLGSGCHIGSKANPIVFNLTTGTTDPDLPNEPVTGTPGDFSVIIASELVEFSGYELRDNAFAVPAAEGCGGIESSIVDPAVDAAIGLPSSDGHNNIDLKGTLKVATEAAVLASE